MAKRLRAFLFIGSMFIYLPSLWSALSSKQASPSFSLLTNWLGPQKTSELINSLNGKVVLVSFHYPFTPEYLWDIKRFNKWRFIYGSSYPFEIVSLVVPEFEPEKNIDQVKYFIEKSAPQFPVGLDINSFLSNAYQIKNTPSFYILDQRNNILEVFNSPFSRHDVEDEIRNTLGPFSSTGNLSFMDKTSIPKLPTFTHLYFGYKNTKNYGNEIPMRAETSINYSPTVNRTLDYYYLKGPWIQSDSFVESGQGRGSLLMPFNTRHFVLLCKAKDSPISIEVRFNGQPLTKEQAGKDILFIQGKTFINVEIFKLYRIFRGKKNWGEGELEFFFTTAGLQIYKASFY